MSLRDINKTKKKIPIKFTIKKHQNNKTDRNVFFFYWLKYLKVHTDVRICVKVATPSEGQ